MDIRIVNTCNNNCKYCLEQWLRSYEEALALSDIYNSIEQNRLKGDAVLWIYWWNPLLHNHITDIIAFAQKIWYSSIDILSNTFSLNKDKILLLKKNGLTGFGVYFHSFFREIHNNIVQDKGISLDILLANIKLIKQSQLNLKVIIHINKLSLLHIDKTINMLIRFYGIKNIEFVNYYPFDRSYKYHKSLSYEIGEFRTQIESMFSIIEREKLSVRFSKFRKTFFWDSIKYYDEYNGIIKQIWEEDILRIESDIRPSCKIENKCNYCFLKDFCKHA